MKLIQEGAFLSEIIFQCDLALQANHKLLHLQNHNKNETWLLIQTILISTGNISKIFWPVKKYKDRGIHLRDLLQIESYSPLRNRTFRNSFEHYDERLEDFLKDKDSFDYVDLAINPSLSYFNRNDCHRGYNAFNHTLIVHGETLDLNELISEVEIIKMRCEKFFF